MPDDAPTLDLSAFDFGPAWAKDPSTSSAPPARVFREERPDRPPHRGGKRPGHFKGRPGHGGPRPSPGQRGPKPRGKFDGPRREERPAPPPNPFPWLRFAFTVTEPAVETVAKQIRQTGKTFSLFDLARLLLRNPESFTVNLSSAPPPPEGPFYVVPSDGSVWMSMEHAARHLLRTRLEEFYRAEVVEIEPPKGNFAVVAVCGMTGALLGPPNHHDFERRLRELHRGKFSRMDFEQFRGRLKMERDPELIEKWKAEASKVTEYYPREGENPAKLADLAAVEKHFLAHHAPTLVEFVPVAHLPGDPKKVRVDSALAPLLNHVRDEEFRFPLRLAQSLSRALSAAGLRFYKTPNRTTFVSAARPRHLNLDEVAVSDSIKKILETIRGQRSLRRPRLLDILAPLPPTPAAPASPPPTPAGTAPAETTPEAPPATTAATDATTPAAAAPEPAAPTPVEKETTPTEEPPVAAAAPAPATPEQTAREAIINDLLWLTHEGYVIEYADGRLESVPPPKKPPTPPPATPESPQVQQPEA